MEKKNPVNILGLGFNIVITNSRVAHPSCTKLYSGRFEADNRDLGIIIFLMPFGSSLKASEPIT